MSELIWEPYKTLLGAETIETLFMLAKSLKGAKIVHVNSTHYGGGVAEILHKMVPLMNGLGLNARWEAIEGNELFFECTKTFHNLFQGQKSSFPDSSLLRNYELENERNAAKLAPILQEADFVFIHDPQPLSMIKYLPERKGKWIWRCHIETSCAPQKLWQYLRTFINLFDASVFSLDNFNQALPHPIYLIPPSIDPLSEKNIELSQNEVIEKLKEFKIDPDRKFIAQISRFDRFKDPVGVIWAFQWAKKYHPGLQLVLAGGSAADDPESMAVLNEIQALAKNDPDIFVLNLPPTSHRIINALQRGAEIILQKSIKEGFGLTVAEALWKMKPVIAGNTGGIRLQVLDQITGVLVNTPEGAARQIRSLLQMPEKGREWGLAGKRLVKENFLITRHLRDYLTLMLSNNHTTC